MSSSSERFEFTAAEIAELLTALDRRLKDRSASGSVLIVGGAAIAVTSEDSASRRTEDVDAITTQLETIIRRYYNTEREALELILDGPDVDQELKLLAERAARVLARR